MKKIITLALCTGLLSAGYAQSAYHDNHYDNSNAGYNYHNDNDYRDDMHSKNYISFRDQKRFEIERINQHYENAIMAVNNNYYMSRRQKRKAIRGLQMERESKIRMINGKYHGYDRR